MCRINHFTMTRARQTTMKSTEKKITCKRLQTKAGLKLSSSTVKKNPRSEIKRFVMREKPNLGLSGNLTADTNTYKGVVIKYNEPPEASMSKTKWRLYVFRNDEHFKPLHMHRLSAFLMGRNSIICDVPILHPSISQQHCIFQYRAVNRKIRGVEKRVVLPYIFDLNSSNGTFLNGEKIEPHRYYELKERDNLQFGLSPREYILISGD